MYMRLLSSIILFLVSSVNLFAQSTLAVNCYDTDTPFNSVSLNDEVIEYGIVSPIPGFYVAVFDQTSCTAWGTNYNGANPSHAFGNYNEANGRQRIEYFFYFQYTDSMQLAGMAQMLQQIPAGHAIAIYTPINYQFNVVNATNPYLVQELATRWNSGVIQGNDVMILFGIQGDSNSYVSETTLQLNQVSFSTQICGELGVGDLMGTPLLFSSNNGNTYTFTNELTVQDVCVLDATGRRIPTQFIQNSLTFPENTSDGVYLFQCTINGQFVHSKQYIQF
jgi:hypothetical protein